MRQQSTVRAMNASCRRKANWYSLLMCATPIPLFIVLSQLQAQVCKRSGICCTSLRFGKAILKLKVQVDLGLVVKVQDDLAGPLDLGIGKLFLIDLLQGV